MRRLRRFPAYLVAGLAILAFTAFLAFALIRLFQVEADMRDNVDENMLWVVTQAQVASHRLDQAVNRLALGDREQDPMLRLDILSSRLNLMDDGPQRRYLVDKGLARPLDSALEELAALRASARGGGTVDQRFRPRSLTPHLDGLMASLNRIANAVMMAEWESTGARLDTYRSSLIQVIGSVVGITLSGLGLTLLLIHALRQRRQAQRALRAHRDLLEAEVSRRTRDLEATRQRVVTAIETAPDGFAYFDGDGHLRLTNPKLAELLPLDPRLLSPGSRLDDVMRAADRLGTQESLATPRSGDDTLHHDLQLSESEWRQLVLLPSRDGSQVLRVSDISRYKQAADVLSQALERERGVSEFYRSFAAMVSHQFRTPLAVIDSGLQRLQRRHHHFTPEQRSERYQRLRDAVAQMTRLVESSLTAARLDGGQVEARPARHSLAALVDHLCHLQRDASGSDRLVTRHASPEVQAWCDRALTEQVLGNLISNALKYSPDDRSVHVITAREGHQAVCRVIDSGPGIPHPEQARLFERFFRGSNAAGTDGIGLGLNIARYLARIQQGDLDVSSSAEAGTTFTLRLPIDQEEIADDTD
ncbi:MAG: ATP-binding protein [Pseudomonadota bacterium]